MRTLAFLLLIFFAVPTPAPTVVIRGPRPVVVASSTNYLIKQDFEGAGYDNSETWTESGTGTIDEDYTGVVLSGSQSLRLNVSAQTARTISPTFSGQTDCWVYFLFRPATATASGTPSICDLRSGSTFVSRVSTDTAGKLTVRNGTSGGVTTVGGMTAGVTYHVWMHYTAGSGANGVSAVAFSTDGVRPTGGNNFAQHTSGNATAGADNLTLGQSVGSGTHTFDFIFDKARVDDATIGDNPL
jgi:hypothetical protein